MKISIIVPAFNEERFIVRTLRKIKSARKAFTELGWGSEVIVCDNNSTDRTASKAAANGATVVFEPVNQISRARNRGAWSATGDWFVFIDADAEPSKELFSDIADAIQSGKFVGGGSTVQMPEVKFMAGIWNTISRAFGWAIGSCLFCDSKAFREVNGFSLEWFAAEEIDLCKRLKKLGRFVVLTKNPLKVSSRKASNYSVNEYLRIWCKALLSGGSNLKDRTQCGFWYAERQG